MKIYIFLAIWGVEYINNFLNISLPSLYSDGNLANNDNDNDNDNDITLSIYAKENEINLILNEKFLTIAQENKINIKVNLIDQYFNNNDNKYSLLSIVQNKGIRDAVKNNFDIFFPLYSDIIFSNNVINFTIDKIKKGSQAVFSCAPQVCTVSIMKFIEELLTKKGNNESLNIAPTQLTNFVLSNVHPEKGPSLYQEGIFKNFPTVFFLQMHNMTFCKAFHLHAVAYKLNNDLTPLLKFKGTFDEHFVPFVFDDITRVYVVEDTSEIFMCSHERVNSDYRYKKIHFDPAGEARIDKIVNIAELHTMGIHREFFRKDIYMNRGEELNLLNFKLYFELNKFTNIILNRLNIDSKRLKDIYPMQYTNRKIKEKRNNQIFISLLKQAGPFINQVKIANILMILKIFLDRIHYNGIGKKKLVVIKKYVINKILGINPENYGDHSAKFRKIVNMESSYDNCLRDYVRTKSYTYLKIISLFK